MRRPLKRYLETSSSAESEPARRPAQPADFFIYLIDLRQAATSNLRYLHMNDLIAFVKQRGDEGVVIQFLLFLFEPRLEAGSFQPCVFGMHDVKDAICRAEKGAQVPSKMVPIASGVLHLMPEVVSLLQLVLGLRADRHSCGNVTVEEGSWFHFRQSLCSRDNEDGRADVQWPAPRLPDQGWDAERGRPNQSEP